LKNPRKLKKKNTNVSLNHNYKPKPKTQIYAFSIPVDESFFLCIFRGGGGRPVEPRLFALDLNFKAQILGTDRLSQLVDPDCARINTKSK
jgi:hypothetical protein